MRDFVVSGKSPPVYTSVYNQFLGVDFSTDPMLVDKSRSPYALNLISDEGGMPQRRPGWRRWQEIEDRAGINGLFHCEFLGENHLLCHAGEKIWRWDGPAPTLLYSGVSDRFSTGFYLMGKFYILTGREYLCYDGQTVAPVVGYVPTVVINRGPEGGGDFVESLNLISPKWHEEFIGNGSAKVFQLSYTNLDDTPVECSIYEGGSWVEKTEGDHFTVDRVKGSISFKSAPATSTLPNIKLTPSKTRSDYAARITNARSCAVYNDGVVFVCGAQKGVDYHSHYGDPTYFPDINYDRVGSDETDIMGYCHLGEYLGIIKESSGQDSTIFLRWGENRDGHWVYLQKQGIVGVGAISRRAVGALLDEPLFLSGRGVFGVTSSSVTYQRTVQNRSYFCDSRLLAETELQNACAVEWKGYYLVAVGGHCYVLDSRKKHYPSRNVSDFVYECFYWENIPARCFLNLGDELFFGTNDGRICRFNTDIEGMQRYRDQDSPITVIWSTCMDDDGHPQHLKSLVGRGCSVTFKPFTRSSAQICLRTESEPQPRLAQDCSVDVFNWQEIDFARMSFDANEAAQDVDVSTKVRRYRRLQFFIRSDAMDEGFGVYQITKTYRVQGLTKA